MLLVSIPQVYGEIFFDWGLPQSLIRISFLKDTNHFANYLDLGIIWVKAHTATLSSHGIIFETNITKKSLMFEHLGMLQCPPAAHTARIPSFLKLPRPVDFGSCSFFK